MDISHLHFLVADTDAAQRRFLGAMLAQMGVAHVGEQSDGHAVLRCLQEPSGAPVDIAIIDLALPGLDGLALIRHLAQGECATAIIIIGAQEKSLLFAVETTAHAYGVDLLGTIAKPVAQHALGALLAHYVPPQPPSARREEPVFGFAEVQAGLAANQFEPYFQPKIELATGHVKGLEAFARWLHPEHGVLTPASFSGALERNKRIDMLDWTMLERSVARCSAFHGAGIPMAVSLNLAHETMAHADFLRDVGACLARHGVLPDYVTFEITESAALTDDAGFLERMVRLRMFGFGLAVDDYGTGASNLQLLARVPFTELKIDRSFVDGASKRRVLGTVLSSCLGLARSLERKSVAVGVETRQDWDFLQGLGCTYAQGYHIAKPMPAENIAGWMEEWRQFF
ncbi:EAL domain-containing response regulator [Massilia glaciei]|uniref:Oxygen sensor protein n=1 Tax=Massilia glaciei TaxID=1524097 RepID=A0A2U2HI01_9BURK|nr:EAL domain-containing response regulator [Massilia glaciei]PWF45961.1 oxygen sensor protein [Massilia glaciei]